MVTNSLCMCLPGFSNLHVMHILFNYNTNVYNKEKFRRLSTEYGEKIWLDNRIAGWPYFRVYFLHKT